MCSHINAPAATKLTRATNLSVEEKSAINCSTDSALLENYPPVLNSSDLSQILGIAVPTVRQMLRLGQIPHFKIGAQYRISKIALLAWMDGGGT